MKKSILSLITAGLLLGSFATQASAAEEVTVGVLTKATTKLIKENRELSQNVLQTQASQEALSNKIEEQKVFIKNISDDNTKTLEKINLAEQNNKKTESLAKDNQSKIGDLYKFKENASKDLEILNNNLKELSKKVGYTENTLNKVTATASQKETVPTPVVDKQMESTVLKLQQNVSSLEAENKSLRDSLSNLKSSTERELNDIKSKLNKQPVVEKQKTVSSDEDKESNDIIRNFIK